MTSNTNELISVITDLEKNIEGLSKSSPSWLNNYRQKQLSRLSDANFPTIKDEDWKYLNLAPIRNQQFSLVLKATAPKQSFDLKNYFSDNEVAVVFFNGSFSKELSQIKGLPQGVTIQTFSESVASNNPSFEKIINTCDYNRENYFAILNKALTAEGIFIHLQQNVVFQRTIHVLHLTDSDLQIATLPRTLISLGKSSEATVLETHISFKDDEVYFHNALTDIDLKENATLNYIKSQKESLKAFHIGSTRVWQESNSNFNGFSFMIGASITRNDMDIFLNGEGANAILDGLYCVNGNQIVDNHTAVDHRVPNCISNQLYKGILNGSSHAIFNGKIFVQPIAQKTNSYQLNKNLLLGKDCRIDTKPQLEIFADDVKCTHGATIGQLNEDEIFYLRSRCISKKEAVNMLAHGFVNDIIERIKDPSIQKKLNVLLEPTFEAI